MEALSGRINQEINKLYLNKCSLLCEEMNDFAGPPLGIELREGCMTPFSVLLNVLNSEACFKCQNNYLFRQHPACNVNKWSHAILFHVLPQNRKTAFQYS